MRRHLRTTTSVFCTQQQRQRSQLPTMLGCGSVPVRSSPADPTDWAAGARTRQPENSKRAHLSAPALQTPPKFHEKTPKEGRKERIFRREREKKARNFGPPTLRFFFPERVGKEQSDTHTTKKKHATASPSAGSPRSPQKWTASPRPRPGPDRARAATVRELWRHCTQRREACWARPRRTGGSPRALALARCRTNAAASSDHLPPTSAPNTTSLVRPFRPWNSGCVASLRRLAATRAAPSKLAQRGCGVPFRRSGDTMVVSTANCAPWNRGNPSTTTSTLRLCNRFGAARSMSWILTFVVTRPPASLHTRATADSRANPLRPTPPPRRTLRGDGHMDRVAGHTGRNDWTRVIATTSDATRERGTAAGQTVCEEQTGNW